MITSVTFKTDFFKTMRNGKEEPLFAKDFRIDLKKGINVLAGGQGCGKSTLIELLRAFFSKKGFMKERLYARFMNEEARKVITVEGDNLDTVNVMGFDFEKDGSRTTSAFDSHGAINNTVYLMRSMRLSHGQANQTALNMLFSDIAKDIKVVDGVKKYDGQPGIIFLDEPDSALSIASIMELHLTLKILQSLGFQIIVSAHNPFFLGCFDDVYNMDEREWGTYRDFLEHQFVTATESCSITFLALYKDSEGFRKFLADRPVFKRTFEEATRESETPVETPKEGVKTHEPKPAKTSTRGRKRKSKEA